MEKKLFSLQIVGGNEKDITYGFFSSLEKVFEVIQQYRHKQKIHIYEIANTELNDVTTTIPCNSYQYIPSLNIIKHGNCQYTRIAYSLSHMNELNECTKESFELHQKINNTLSYISKLMDMYAKQKSLTYSLSTILVDDPIWNQYILEEDYNSLEKYIVDMKEIIQKRKDLLQMLEEMLQEWKQKTNFIGNVIDLLLR